MKKEIQTLVAMQLLSLRNDITIYNYNNNKITEEKSLNIKSALEKAISEGLDIMLPLQENQVNENENSIYYRGYTYYKGYEGKITFVEKMMENHNTDKDIINYLYEKITADDLKKSHPNFVKNIYEVLRQNGISMKKMFEIGFDFEQGKFDEENKAISGDLDFFECCLYYKKNFDFNFNYFNYTLKEIIKEEINYLKNNEESTEKLENLINFIDKAILKQKLENKEIFQHTIKENKIKI
jgi:hypothetical protein